MKARTGQSQRRRRTVEGRRQTTDFRRQTFKSLDPKGFDNPAGLNRLNPVAKGWCDLKATLAAQRTFNSLLEREVAMRGCFADFTCQAARALTHCSVLQDALAGTAEK